MTEKKYILQNTDSKWVTIVSIDDLSYTNYQNMIEYKSKYYILKASIKEQSITIEVVFKIWMLNNLGPAFKTYLTVVNSYIRKDKNLKTIKEVEFQIPAEQKSNFNFVTTKSLYF